MHSEDFNFSAEYESQKKKSHFQPVQNNAALNLNLTHSSCGENVLFCALFPFNGPILNWVSSTSKFNSSHCGGGGGSPGSV